MEKNKTEAEKASQVHPDKKTNDPQAAATFQILREAYQVLTNWSKHSVSGKQVLSRDFMLDPTAAFALLFGSKLLKDHIGHLVVESMASSELAPKIGNSENHPEGSQDVQGESQEELAGILKGFLNQYVNGDKDEFLRRARFEAEHLSNAGWKSQLTASRGVELPQPQGDAQRGRGPTIVNDSLWKLCVENIEMTHLHVCQMVLQEKDVSEKDLTFHTEALKRLEEIFQEEKLSPGADSSKKKTTADSKDGGDDNDSSVSNEKESPSKIDSIVQSTKQLFRRFLCDPTRIVQAPIKL